MMTVAEYLAELIGDMRAIMTRVDEMARDAMDEEALNAIGREGIRLWEEMLARLTPPPQLEALHERLCAIATSPPDDEALTDVYLELARRAEAEGLDFLPGITVPDIEEMREGPKTGSIIVAGGISAEGDWEPKLRRALEEGGHPDVEGAIDSVRRLRGEEG
jgi:hypothetical protein